MQSHSVPEAPPAAPKSANSWWSQFGSGSKLRPMPQLYTLCQSQCRPRPYANFPWPLSLLYLCITKLVGGGGSLPSKIKQNHLNTVVSSLRVKPAQAAQGSLLVCSLATRTVGHDKAERQGWKPRPLTLFPPFFFANLLGLVLSQRELHVTSEGRRMLWLVD